MKKWNDVTSLERSAMTRIKGGKRPPCTSVVACQGEFQAIREVIALSKAEIEEEFGPEEEDAEENED
jgi:hypothetical protein